MSLIYFHRFLIITFIFFCGYFAWHMGTRWRGAAGTTTDLVSAVVAVAAALGFFLYLRTVKVRRSDGSPPVG